MTNILDYRKQVIEIANEVKVKEILDREKKYSYVTYMHSIVTALYVSAMLEILHWNKIDREHIITGALIHDIGKTEVSKLILNKQGRLDDYEIQCMNQHCVNGFRITADSFGKIETEIVLLHHEKINGSGYPAGITRDKIPEYVKIVTVADMYEALTSNRCYKRAYTKEESLEILGKAVKNKELEEIYVDVLKHLQ